MAFLLRTDCRKKSILWLIDTRPDTQAHKKFKLNRISLTKVDVSVLFKKTY